MPITAPTLSISPEKVCFFIVKAHEYDIADSGANVADDGMIDPTFQELTAFINGLTEDEQVDLVALTWLGRGDGELSDWNDLRNEAARLHNNRTAAYLLGNPMLGDHLEQGLRYSAFPARACRSRRKKKRNKQNVRYGMSQLDRTRRQYI
jgi:hypothetical protein